MIYKHKKNGKKYEFLESQSDTKLVKLKSLETNNVLYVTESNFNKFYKRI